MRAATRQEPSPPTHLERQREVARVFAEEGFDWLVDEAGVSKFVPTRHLKRQSSPEMGPEQHIRHALERLGVTFIKGGQALSTRADVIPPALAAELAKLQDEVPAEPFHVVRSAVEEQLGMPIEEAFASFEREPLGAASIGQVHRAVLPSGTRVAVKIQRPGIVELAQVDLDIALGLARRAQGRFRDFADADLVGLAGEFADAVRGEFDYVREGRNAEELARAFEGDEGVVIPCVYWTHTTSKVLTLDLLEGIRMNRLDELDTAGCDKALLARRGIDAYLHMIFDVGLFHADPHPGNFIALPGDRVGFTDFGRVGTMSAESRDRFIDLLYAVVTRDEEAAAEALLSLSTARDVDETALQADISRVISRYYGRELGTIRTGDIFGDALSLLRTHHLGMPNDFALMLATLAVLEGVGVHLDPTFDFVSAVRPFAERAIRNRYRLSELAERFGHDVLRAARTLERAPSALDRILRRAARGEFRLELVPRDYEGLLGDLSALVNRLAFAIVVAALIVGASTLLGATQVPAWLKTVGQVGFVAGLAVSFWLFGSIIVGHYRGNHRR